MSLWSQGERLVSMKLLSAGWVELDEGSGVEEGRFSSALSSFEALGRRAILQRLWSWAFPKLQPQSIVVFLCAAVERAQGSNPSSGFQSQHVTYLMGDIGQVT